MGNNRLMTILNKITNNFYFRNIFLAGLILVAFFMVVFIFLRVYTHHNQSFSVPDLIELPLEEAENMLKEKKLKYSVIDSVYLPNIEKGVIIEQNPPPNFKVKKGRTIFLTTNAHSPEKVIIPSVKGVSLRQASALLETKGLKIGELIYVPDVAINYVLDMKHNDISVNEGDTIYKGTFIDLVVGKGLGDKKARVPDLIAQNLENAMDMISMSFLNLGATIYDNTVIDHEDSTNAIIWKQHPEHDAHIHVQLGSFVDVWLTLDSTKLPLPDTLMINDGDTIYEFDPKM